MNEKTSYNGRQRSAFVDFGLRISDFGLARFNPQSRVPSGCRNPQFFGALFCALIALPIVAARAAAGDAGSTDAFRVFDCKFDQQWDEDFDSWPDRWVRRSEIDYPHYVNIAIQDDETEPGRKCLQIDLDGASAAVASPAINVMSRFSYVFEAQLKCERLEHSTCTLTLNFCDASGRVLLSESQSRKVTKGWERITFEPMEPGNPNITQVVISLKVARGSKGDLQGRVSLAEVWLARLPRIVVSTNNPCNVYTLLNDVEIQCELSGIQERDAELHFQLFDALNQVQDAGKTQFNGQLIVDEKRHAEKVKDGVGQAPDSFEGRATWRPKIADYGFYRVDVEMESSHATDPQIAQSRKFGTRRVWFAVVPPLAMPRQGEFGWTLPKGDEPLQFQDLTRLLPQVGISWVKLPVWFDASDPRRGDELIRFVELLGASNIEAVGIIDQPPASESVAGKKRDIPAADLLLDASAPWLASLEPVMARLALRIRWWQLGRDGDTSFADVSALVKRIEDLRTLLFRFGQDVKLGMSWDWDAENAIPGPVTWDFEQLCIQEHPSEEEFDKLLLTPRKSAAEHWIMIEPPPISDQHQYDAAAQASRASEFVWRMVLAKVRGADRIFVSNPFDEVRGLMPHNGMPGELLLPWRTTAAMLGGAEYLGQMQLPESSENRVFLRPDGKVVMVVWNSKPTREKLFLGNQVQCIDLDGRSSSPESDGSEQVVSAGPKPAFVLGLHEAIARWRMALALERKQVPSIYNKPHRNSLAVQNFFPQGVGGSLKIVVQPQERFVGTAANKSSTMPPIGLLPESLNIEPAQRNFALAPGEAARFPFAVRLKNAYYGPQPVRLDFTIQAEEEYSFSAYMQMDVGSKDLTLDVKTHVDKDGTLIVEQLMTNKSERLTDFRCLLFPMSEHHRRQRMKVYRLGPKLDRKVYRIPNGRLLVGRELRLEIEEINGPRMLKYRFIATKNRPAVAQPGTKEGEEPVQQDPENSEEPSRFVTAE